VDAPFVVGEIQECIDDAGGEVLGIKVCIAAASFVLLVERFLECGCPLFDSTVVLWHAIEQVLPPVSV